MSRPRPVAVTPALLRRMALPEPDEDGSKEDRGRVLVVGGSANLPGAILLAGIAALRAGCGKLQLATIASMAGLIGVQAPEARVFGLPATKEGGIDGRDVRDLLEWANKTQAVLIGPGMLPGKNVDRLVATFLESLGGPVIVLDAAALACCRRVAKALHRHAGRVILTPHAGEMAGMLGCDKNDVTLDPITIAQRAAAELVAVVALKGATTFIAAPDGDIYRYDSGHVGLATSGSGDALAGIVAGLAARGAEPLRAALWGAALHGGAGNVLATRHGPIGYLARELLDEIPAVMARLGRAAAERRVRAAAE